MTTTNPRTALEREFAESVADLQAALQQASDASARVQALLPRVGSISNLLAELDSVIRSGRDEIGDGATAAAYTRPTLVVPNRPASAAVPQPFAAASTRPAVPPVQAATAALTSFRLEFESDPGPLDLRTVDDAVSEHPAVRDVALLDYDGRKATLKVWIEPSAKPADVQSALSAKSPSIFGSGSGVTIVALEDAA